MANGAAIISFRHFSDIFMPSLKRAREQLYQTASNSSMNDQRNTSYLDVH